MKQYCLIVVAWLAVLLAGAQPPLPLPVAPGSTITITVGPGLVVTNAITPAPPMPPRVDTVSLSQQMRQAAQMARGKAAVWNQRWIATKVEQHTLDQPVLNEYGLHTGATVFLTNYVVTLLPVADDTNAPVAWGAVKARTIRITTLRPTVKGDEFDFFPIKQ